MSFRRSGKRGQPSAALRLLLLALFFLCGVCLGQVLAGRVPAETGQELSAYLRGYLEADAPVTLGAVLSALLLYVRYPLLAALLGFASVGVLLLPGVTVMFGLFLSFSVSCFAAAFGSQGVLLALAALGPRCLVTLPCYFLLAVPSWESAAALASLSFGRGRRAAPVSYGSGWWTRTGVCCLILLAGVCAELLCVPPLLRMALELVF